MNIKKFGAGFSLGSLLSHIALTSFAALAVNTTFMGEAHAAWFDEAWTNRVAITIDADQVPSDVTDFPVYVDMSDLPGTFFDGINSDGSDIRITTSDGTTEVPREIVRVDTTNDLGEMYFKASGSLSSSTDTTFYIYYGNGSGTEPGSGDDGYENNVWPQYKHVYHLDGSSVANMEESVNDFDFNIPNSGVEAYQETGKIGRGVRLQGSNPHRLLSDSYQPNDAISSFSFRMWVKSDITSGNKGLFYYRSNGNSGWMFGQYGTKFRFYGNRTSGGWMNIESTTTIAADTWYHVAGHYDGTNLELYVNGTQEASSAMSTPNISNNVYLSVGTASFGTWDGLIDNAFFSQDTDIDTDDWISTEYNNQNSPGTFYTVGSEESQGGEVSLGWYNNDWNFRSKLTLQSGQVSGNQVDFPVYVDLSEMPSGFWNQVESTGADIRVTANDGTTELPLEIVEINTGAETGELHFKASNIAGGSNTDFYVYFGNSAASARSANHAYGSNNVWKNDYKGVYHLGEATNNNADNFEDSTSNDNHGSGTSMNTTAVSGQLSTDAQDFDNATAKYIDLGSQGTNYSNAMSMSMWVNVSDQASDHTAVQIGNNGNSGFQMDINSDETVSAKGYDTGWNVSTSGSSISTGTWTHVAASWSGAGNELKLFVNGVEQSSPATLSSNASMNASSTRIGVYGSNDQYFRGKIDELRMANGSRTAGWYVTEYNNHSNTATFYSIAAMEGRADSAGDDGGDGWVLSNTGINITMNDPQPAVTAGNLYKQLVLDVPLKSKYTNDTTNRSDDRCPSRAHGTLSGVTVSSTDYDFDGSNDYVTLPSSLSDYFEDGTYSLSLWFKADGVTGSKRIFSVDYLANGNHSFYAMVDSNNLSINAKDGSTLSTITFPIATGTWYHMAISSSDGANITLYVNGKNEGTATARNFSEDNNEVHIGRSSTNFATDKYFDGKISGVRVYDRALIAKDTSLLFEKGR